LANFLIIFFFPAWGGLKHPVEPVDSAGAAVEYKPLIHLK
jgi:hypothetical protein